jgi:NADPH-dependent ferric siderophore reductase
VSTPVIRRSPVRPATVVATERLTPRMQRVTVECPELAGTTFRPAQDVELLLREPTGRRVKRRYTIRHARPETGRLDLDVLLHGEGPGSRWGQTARPGDGVELQGPRGKLELRPAPWHLLVGDESALPAIAAIAEALPPDEPAVAYVEVQDGADELPVAAAELHWVHRGAAPAGGAEVLTDALAGLRVPSGARAYLMGESRAMVALRAVVEAAGVDHDSIFVKGYWNLGRPDRLAGHRPPPSRL